MIDCKLQKKKIFIKLDCFEIIRKIITKKKIIHLILKTNMFY